jgi:hypothetical protein
MNITVAAISVLRINVLLMYMLSKSKVGFDNGYFISCCSISLSVKPLLFRYKFTFLVKRKQCIRMHPPQFSRYVMEHLNEQFPDRWIGCNVPRNWPLRSPDLTLVDSLVWGYMKNMVYELEVNRRGEPLH